ncbi:MAG: 50S ribosomal protein L24 [Microscillaceae bacterium]|jgi:large subunit ribosomal protein L24|nr:50S ribosomal protein L24 [Microscillaceae bacterium]
MERKKNKQPKLHIKVGDMVLIIAGDEKDKKGRVLSIDVEKKRAIVEDRNKVKKHVKPSTNNPNGKIESKEASIHISNLMVIDESTGEAHRTGRKRDENGKLQRYFKPHSSNKEA